MANLGVGPVPRDAYPGGVAAMLLRLAGYLNFSRLGSVKESLRLDVACPALVSARVWGTMKAAAENSANRRLEATKKRACVRLSR